MVEQPPGVDQAVHPDAKRFDGWFWSDPGRGEHFRRCSFCGSVDPVDLAAERLWDAEWADRKYGWPHKFYVDIVNRNSDAQFVISCGFGENSTPARDAVLWANLTDDQRAVCDRDGYGEAAGRLTPRWLVFAPRARHHAKFYTIHLSDRGLDPAVKQAIEQRSGLRFTFAGSRVHWTATEP